jgi:hypothetical protein
MITPSVQPTAGFFDRRGRAFGRKEEIMPILTRRVGESLIIGQDVTVTVLAVKHS